MNTYKDFVEEKDYVNPFDYFSNDDCENHRSLGLTKREFFAAFAMQGILSMGFITEPDEIAAKSVDIAEKLIKQLNNTNNE